MIAPAQFTYAEWLAGLSHATARVGSGMVWIHAPTNNASSKNVTANARGVRRTSVGQPTETNRAANAIRQAKVKATAEVYLVHGRMPPKSLANIAGTIPKVTAAIQYRTSENCWRECNRFRSRHVEAMPPVRPSQIGP